MQTNGGSSATWEATLTSIAASPLDVSLTLSNVSWNGAQASKFQHFVKYPFEVRRHLRWWKSLACVMSAAMGVVTLLYCHASSKKIIC